MDARRTNSSVWPSVGDKRVTSGLRCNISLDLCLLKDQSGCIRTISGREGLKAIRKKSGRNKDGEALILHGGRVTIIKYLDSNSK